ncbi:MAG: hypothetical protein RR495_07430 [Anaerovoracaceae bacterium]
MAHTSAKRTVYAFIDAFLHRRDMDEALGYFANDAQCIGVSDGEIAVGKKEIGTMLNTALKTSPNSFNTEYYSYNEIDVSEDTTSTILRIGVRDILDNHF